ncbi:MAG: hypothetical protein ABW202_15460 [Duganella sp.]
MKKSDLIVQLCLHRGEAANPQEAHTALLLMFNEEYPIANFTQWDSELDQEWAESFYLRYRDDTDCDMRWLLTGLSQVK